MRAVFQASAGAGPAAAAGSRRQAVGLQVVLGMKYEVGQRFLWFPDRPHEGQQIVRVVELRSRGYAKLSNGWTVDEDGIAQGTNRTPGGRVIEVVEGDR